MIVDISNRQSFINKKIIEALTKQREETLLQQKEDHENLIHSGKQEAQVPRLMSGSEREGG